MFSYNCSYKLFFLKHMIDIQSGVDFWYLILIDWNFSETTNIADVYYRLGSIVNQNHNIIGTLPSEQLIDN